MNEKKDIDINIPEEADRVARIRRYEELYDRAVNAVRTITETWESSRDAFKALESYYESGEWLKDYESDEAGKLPADLKRGVLSQDGLYNLMKDYDRLADIQEERTNCATNKGIGSDDLRRS